MCIEILARRLVFEAFGSSMITPCQVGMQKHMLVMYTVYAYMYSANTHTLHYIALHCIALHCIALHYITLHIHIHVFHLFIYLERKRERSISARM